MIVCPDQPESMTERTAMQPHFQSHEVADVLEVYLLTLYLVARRKHSVSCRHVSCWKRSSSIDMTGLSPYRIATSSIITGGSGVFANRDIKVEELIISEAALFTSATLSQIETCYQNLNDTDKASFNSLTDVWNPDKPTKLNIFKTNALPLGVGSQMRGASFQFLQESTIVAHLMLIILRTLN